MGVPVVLINNFGGFISVWDESIQPSGATDYNRKTIIASKELFILQADATHDNWYTVRVKVWNGSALVSGWIYNFGSYTPPAFKEPFEVTNETVWCNNISAYRTGLVFIVRQETDTYWVKNGSYYVDAYHLFPGDAVMVYDGNQSGIADTALCIRCIYSSFYGPSRYWEFMDDYGQAVVSTLIDQGHTMSYNDTPIAGNWG